MLFNTKLPLISILIVLAALSAIHISVYAADLTLAWDESATNDVLGYRAYVRQIHQRFDFNDWAWQGTETSCTLHGLALDAVYCFVVRAFNASGESRNSAEICVFNPLLIQLFDESADMDCDVDGEDLADHAAGLLSVGLKDLAYVFGKTFCRE
jgi:hypothetical protein